MDGPAADVQASARLERLLNDEATLVRRATDALLRRVTAVSQRSLRRPLLQELLTGLDDALLLALLAHLLPRARSGDLKARLVAQEIALAPGLVQSLPYPRVQTLYRLSSEAGLLELRALFLSDRRETREDTHTENDFLPLPLGMRKQAARTRDRDLLDRLLRDRDPSVIAQLLLNPRLREQDVITIAAMRPTNTSDRLPCGQHRCITGTGCHCRLARRPSTARSLTRTHAVVCPPPATLGNTDHKPHSRIRPDSVR